MRIRHLDKVCWGLRMSYDALIFIIGFCQSGTNTKQGKRKQVKMAVRTNIMRISDTRFIHIHVYSVQTARQLVNGVTKRVRVSAASNTDCQINVRTALEKKERKE